MNYVLISFALIIAVVSIFVLSSKSTFVDDILFSNYDSVGCTAEDRSTPSGHIPGSYFGLTKAERENLLKNFINYNPNLT
jgi:hypothetical protein